MDDDPHGFDQMMLAPRTTPWLVPACQPLELLFFHRVFEKLSKGPVADAAGEMCQGVHLRDLQRGMCRLLRVLKDDREFVATKFDLNHDGVVGWWEFCCLWKEMKLAVNFSMAERIFMTLEDPTASRLGRLVSCVVLLAIVFSATSFVVSTMPSMQEKPLTAAAIFERTGVQVPPEPFQVFRDIDTICVILFTIEYVLRLVTAAWMRVELVNEADMIGFMCTEESVVWPSPFQRMLKFGTGYANLIDLAAILPSYIQYVIPKDEDSAGTMPLVKMIRLMRVVRAFRLGRRLEPVIIMARTMVKSVRVLAVLVLNIVMGVLCFGSVMFFLEQGDYFPSTGAYCRTPVSDDCMSDDDLTPFASIPGTFWWALVTATTVGYGDVLPSTTLGKFSAGFAMVWSLCVLALPVGVIGDNFQEIWDQYDKENRMEKELQAGNWRMVRNAVHAVDPVMHAKVMLVEVFHDSAMHSAENDVFIGEAEVHLELDPSSPEEVTRSMRLPLQSNRKKSGRSVSGAVFLEYTWTPRQATEPGVVVYGELQISLLHAEGLAAVDWKRGARSEAPSDPYVRVTVKPTSPASDGSIKPKEIRFRTIFDESMPMWNDTVSVDFLWRIEGVQAKKRVEREALNAQTTQPALETSIFAHEESRRPLALLQTLRGDLCEVKESLPGLQEEVRLLRDSTRAILQALGLPPPAESGAAEDPVLRQLEAEMWQGALGSLDPAPAPPVWPPWEAFGPREAFGPPEPEGASSPMPPVESGARAVRFESYSSDY